MKTPLLIFLIALSSLTYAQPKKQAPSNSWLKFHGLNQGDFVQLGEPGQLNMKISAYNISNKELFKPFLIFSPDSSRFIDLDSYSIALEKDSAGKYFSYSSKADTKTQLVTISDSTSLIILFCGTLCYPEAALWTSNTEFEIYGFHVLNSKKHIPTIWKVNTEKMTMNYLQHKSFMEQEPKDYIRQVRLKDINFISR